MDWTLNVVVISEPQAQENLEKNMGPQWVNLALFLGTQRKKGPCINVQPQASSLGSYTLVNDVSHRS